MTEYIGTLSVCSKGDIGYVTGYREIEWGWSYVGIKLDGTPWASKNPRILEAHPTLDLIERLVAKYQALGYGDRYGYGSC